VLVGALVCAALAFVGALTLLGRRVEP